MPFSSARRRAEDFAASVDGRTPERPLDEQTRALVTLTQSLRGLEGVEPRAEFSADLRARLVSEADRVLTAAPTRRRTPPVSTPREVRRRRLTSVAAAACVTIGAGAGVAAASQSALPGDALYPVKRGIEQIELTLSGGGQGHGEELLEQAGTRLVEAQDLTVRSGADPQSADHVSEALRTFRSQATDGGDELIRVFEENGETDAVRVLRTFVAESGSRLDDLADTVPPAAQDDLAAAADALTELDAAARAACPTCSDLAPLQLSGALIGLRTDVDGVLEQIPDKPAGDQAPKVGAPSASGAAEPGVTLPTGALPTVPGGDGTAGGGEQTQVPDGGDDVTNVVTPGPAVDLGETTVTAPNLGDPTGVVPSLVEPVESVLEPAETILEPVETLLDDPLGLDD